MSMCPGRVCSTDCSRTRAPSVDRALDPCDVFAGLLYEGTRLGRQELFAEILEEVPGALWNRTNLEANRIPPREGAVDASHHRRDRPGHDQRLGRR